MYKDFMKIKIIFAFSKFKLLFKTFFSFNRYDGLMVKRVTTDLDTKGDMMFHYGLLLSNN